MTIEIDRISGEYQDLKFILITRNFPNPLSATSTCFLRPLQRIQDNPYPRRIPVSSTSSKIPYPSNTTRINHLNWEPSQIADMQFLAISTLAMLFAAAFAAPVPVPGVRLTHRLLCTATDPNVATTGQIGGQKRRLCKLPRTFTVQATTSLIWSTVARIMRRGMSRHLISRIQTSPPLCVLTHCH